MLCRQVLMRTLRSLMLFPAQLQFNDSWQALLSRYPPQMLWVPSQKQLLIPHVFLLLDKDMATRNSCCVVRFDTSLWMWAIPEFYQLQSHTLSLPPRMGTLQHV